MTDRSAALRVFAVEDTTVQATWSALAPGRWDVAAGRATAAVDADGGPGSVVLEGLAPASGHLLVAEGPGGRHEEPFTTLPAPPGPLRCRIATVGDLHVGAVRVGHLPKVAEDGTEPEPTAVRCARAALVEAVAWGADVVVVKGDLCQYGLRRHWDAVGPLLAALPVPVEVVAGNHDLYGREGRAGMRAGLAAHGVGVVDGVAARDLPGVRLVVVDTTVAGKGGGRVADRQADVVAAVRGAAAAGRPALVAMHHHPQRWAVPTFWPPGIPGPEASRFLDAVAGANPASLVTSNHTHRHRARRVGPLVVTEVGSTKDYPGTWAGYAVHDGGIRQVVRRVADPAAIRWTERVGTTLLGLWAAWSPGRLEDRCLTHRWPRS